MSFASLYLTPFNILSIVLILYFLIGIELLKNDFKSIFNISNAKLRNLAHWDFTYESTQISALSKMQAFVKQSLAICFIALFSSFAFSYFQDMFEKSSAEKNLTKEKNNQMVLVLILSAIKSFIILGNDWSLIFGILFYNTLIFLLTNKFESYQAPIFACFTVFDFVALILQTYLYLYKIFENPDSSVPYSQECLEFIRSKFSSVAFKFNVNNLGILLLPVKNIFGLFIIGNYKLLSENRLMSVVEFFSPYNSIYGGVLLFFSMIILPISISISFYLVASHYLISKNRKSWIVPIYIINTPILMYLITIAKNCMHWAFDYALCVRISRTEFAKEFIDGIFIIDTYSTTPIKITTLIGIVFFTFLPLSIRSNIILPN